MLFASFFERQRDEILQNFREQRVISNRAEETTSYDALADSGDPGMVSAICKAAKRFSKCQIPNDVKREEL